MGCWGVGEREREGVREWEISNIGKEGGNKKREGSTLWRNSSSSLFRRKELSSHRRRREKSQKKGGRGVPTTRPEASLYREKETAGCTGHAEP